MALDTQLPEQEIQAYLALLRPVPLSDSSTCPLCLEPYADFSDDSVTDYPARPGVQWSGFQCNHVFGRVCIEQHIRSGEEYSARCPICREAWFRLGTPEPGESVLDIGGHRVRRRRRNALFPSLMPPGYGDDSADEADVESEWSTVANEDDGAGGGSDVVIIRQLRDIVDRLEVLQEYYLVEEMDEEEVGCLQDAVNSIHLLFDRRCQRLGRYI
jgi:hypothetical protein